MVPIETISSTTLIETRDAFWYFFFNAEGQGSSTLGQISRENLIAFIEDVTGVKGLKTPGLFSKEDFASLLKRIDGILNELLLQKFKEEGQKQQIPVPTKTTPVNLDRLVEVYNAYLKEKNEKGIRDRAEKQQAEWVNKQKIYLRRVGEKESVVLSRSDIESLRTLKNSPNDIVTKLSDNKNLGYLSKQYDIESLRVFAPSIALDVEQRMLLQKNIGVGRQTYLPLNRSSLVNFVSAGIGTSQAMEFAAAYSSLQAMNYDVIAVLYGNKVAKVLYGSKDVKDFLEVSDASKSEIGVDIASYRELTIDFSRERKEREEFLDKMLGSPSNYIQSDFRGISSLLGKDKTERNVTSGSLITRTLGSDLPAYLGVNPQLSGYAEAINLLGHDMQILFATNGVSAQLTAQLSAAWVMEVQFFPSLAIGITPAVTASAEVLVGSAASAEAGVAIVAAEAATEATVVSGGIGAVLSGVASAIGTPLVGLVTGIVVAKILPWIKNNIGKISAAFILTGILLGGLIGSLFAGTGLLIGFGSGSFVTAGSNFLSTIPSFIVGLGGTVIGALAVPTVIVLVSIPVLVAFILFIINSSAYVTPQGGGVSANPNSNAKLCLPSDGTIKQLPYCESGDPTLSHCTGNENAYDIANVKGTVVYAATSGTVTYYMDTPDGTYNGGYGYYAIVAGGGYTTYYGHMIINSGLPVGSSKPIKAGDQIGLMDSTGNVTGSHVHFEMRQPSGNIADIFGNAVMNQQVQNLTNFPECLTK